MSAALNFAETTAPESNSLFQPVASPTPNIELAGLELKTRIERTLVANSYWRGPATEIAAREPETAAQLNTLRISRQINKAILSAFAIPNVAPPSLSLQPLQEWEGYVIDIQEDIFTARLVDLTAGRAIEEEKADFPISDLSDDDRELLTIGAVFRWVIGYQRSPGGTKRRVSQITFRRLPAWTRKEIEQSRKAADNILQEISWE